MQALTEFKGVGTAVTKKLAQAQIHNIEDLLLNLPSQYQDRTHVTAIEALRVGDKTWVQGRIVDVVAKPYPRRQLMVSIDDGTGRLMMRLFHFNMGQQQGLLAGQRINCFGEARRGRLGFEMVHPEYRLQRIDAPIQVEETLTPVYRTAKGLSTLLLRRLVQQTLSDPHLAQVPELLPKALLKQYDLMPIGDALHWVHQPPPDVGLSELSTLSCPAQQRLIFEELLAHHVSLCKVRVQTAMQSAPACIKLSPLIKKLETSLPFEFTRGQSTSFQSILNDLKKPHPMMRLLQGDVGSGKTVVAAMAALQVIEHGLQVAIMAPTEILAEQHHQTFLKWLEPLGVHVSFLSGKLKARDKRSTTENIALGLAQVVVGTHALFQQKVEFKQLGLVVIDEQHRFGVDQRLKLREKGMRGSELWPHMLIMTATPIPRTLTMTLYADLDVSVMKDMPKARKPITTVTIPNQRRTEVIEKMRRLCDQGQQVYWICPLIELSEQLNCQTVEQALQILTEQLPEHRIGMVHGQMSSEDKEQAMLQFHSGHWQILVATTVVEVGVDVPNATLIVIENAERMGLSQLHQLRGRVGRGNLPSYCVLLYQTPLTETARTRLDVLRKITDGFVISQKDLQLRGPGEVLGTKQTGLYRFRLADLMRDHSLLPDIQQASQWLLEHHPEMIKPLLKRWFGHHEKYVHA